MKQEKRIRSKLNKGNKMIIHTRTRYFILLIIPLIPLILLPAFSLAAANMISQSSDIYKEKIESYKQTIRINPDNADVHYNLGVAFVCAGMHKEAIESFQQVIRINPDDTDAHSALEQYEMLKSIDPKLAN